VLFHFDTSWTIVVAIDRNDTHFPHGNVFENQQWASAV
jgi:hypothetical protein